MVHSGEQQVRKRTSHIVHPAQTQADALNEFAGRLVFPSERYVTHVRQLGEYHQVKLRPPLEGDAGDGARRPDPDQPDDIRHRSRRLYETAGRDTAETPAAEPVPVAPRRVTRRPGGAPPEE